MYYIVRLTIYYEIEDMLILYRYQNCLNLESQTRARLVLDSNETL